MAKNATRLSIQPNIFCLMEALCVTMLPANKGKLLVVSNKDQYSTFVSSGE